MQGVTRVENNQLEALLQTILDQTVALESSVLDENSEPDEWSRLLDERQQTMDQLSELIDRGMALSEDQKRNYVAKAYAIDQRLEPVMNGRKKSLGEKIGSITSTKNTVKKYNHYSNIAYFSSFFDQKK